MLPEIIGVPDAKPRDLKDDEVLIVLGPKGERSAWVNDLVKEAYPSLAKSHHYSRYHVGFGGSGGARPFLVLEWTREGNSALERRWVVGRLGRFLSNQFSLKKLVIYLEKGSGAEQLALAED